METDWLPEIEQTTDASAHKVSCACGCPDTDHTLRVMKDRSCT
jgi:hypothetical protein